MPTPRRSFLHILGLTSVSLTAGCVDTVDAVASFVEGECEVPPDTDPVRASGDNIAVTETVTDDEVEYLPETDEVRYVAAWRRVEGSEGDESPAREPVYDTVPFERWATVQSETIASQRLQRVLTDRLGSDHGVEPWAGEDGLTLVVEYRCLDGDVVSSPAEGVTVETVTDAAPATVEVTFTFEGIEAMRSVPVFVQRWTLYYT